MAGMVTITHASSLKDLDRKLSSIKSEHERINPYKDIVVKVLNPDPNTVTFNDYESISFSVSVDIVPREEDED